MSTTTMSLLAFMQDQLANNEDASDEELAQHLSDEGVPHWLAHFYVRRHRARALATPIPKFEEPNELVDACVHLALGFAQDRSMLDDDMLPHAEALAGNLALIAGLIEALEAATAYVELSTANGTRKQPPAWAIQPNGDFDAELIASRGRAALEGGAA